MSELTEEQMELFQSRSLANQCVDCGIEAEPYIGPYTKDGITWYGCEQCVNPPESSRARIAREKRQEKAQEVKRTQAENPYVTPHRSRVGVHDISHKQYEDLLDSQEGKCAILPGSTRGQKDSRMIERVIVKNYQSLHDIELELSRLTVIVGQSSSGKSALTRALNALTGNQRGTSFITHGENQTTIIAKTDKGTVALQRGKKDAYVIVDESGEQKQYTKLAGGVPEEVSQFLGIPAKDPLNYANQFDMPYLLTASSSEVARTLGELTNVSVIFEAAREANKRRLSASSTLKTRVADTEKLDSQLSVFDGLDTRKKNLDEATALIEESQGLSQKIEQLSLTVKAASIKPVKPKKTKLPDLTQIKKLNENVKALQATLNLLSTGLDKLKQLASHIETSNKKLITSKQEYLETLRSLGVCPTCKQGTEELTHVH